MNPQDINVLDWQRILIGQAPWSFLIETFIRGVIIYVTLLVCIRVMGKSVSGQLSTSELAIIVTLGAAVGVPMQVPERGMLPALIVLIVAILYERGIGYLSFRYRNVELVTQGDLVTLVTDGRIDVDQLKKVSISRERLLAFLRRDQVEQLGQVDRVYLEAPGALSVVHRLESQPGLSIFPAVDLEIRQQQLELPDLYACTSCGKVVQGHGIPNENCEDCASKRWEHAVFERSFKLKEKKKAA